MPYGLYLSAAGASVQSRRLQTIAHNLANVDTPAFKRQLALVQARPNARIERGSTYPEPWQAVSGGVEWAATLTDLRPGPTRRTGLPGDLALEDPYQFFVVEQDGRLFLTRAGSFRFTADGQMVDMAGRAVWGDDGPIRIDPNQPWTITARGAIAQQGEEVARLRLVRPQNPEQLRPVGGNLFDAGSQTDPVPDEARRVLVGHLEMSGVEPALELMEMIEASRAFEANARMLQHQDQASATLINRLLRAA
ncbi:MAG: flagellar basal body protein [Pirellulaceae bacterium]|nr:MAG: flagellar basal body protein [Pirellulaceae bacterium]